MTAKPMPVIKLDWSRLLGFDQAPQGDDRGADTGPIDRRLTKLGAKIGQKTGAKRTITGAE